jgi:hypothetical protein
LRHFLVNEGMSILQFLRMLVRETRGSEKSTKSLIVQHGWNREGYMMYEDVYKTVEHILAGNTDGGVISRREMSEQIFPLLDPKGSGKILMSDFIDLVYQHEISTISDPMLATKAYGSKARPKPKIDPKKMNVTKAAGHRAEVLWTEQQVDIDSLELSKVYGHDKYDSKKERLLTKYLLDHYATGLTYVFETYCTVTHGASKANGILLFQDRASHDQIKFTNASTMVHDFKLISSRAKVEHFEKRLDAPKKYKCLPKGTFCHFVWIDQNINSVPRLTKTGALPVTPIEIKERFIHRTRHVMQWRKLDTASGLTSIASLALFLMDIADIACSRMEAGPELWEREMQSKEAVQAYYDAAPLEAMKNNGREGQQRLIGTNPLGLAAQKKIAQNNINSLIEGLSMKQKVEAVLIHLQLDSSNKKVLKRGLMFRQRNTFKYPVGNGIASVIPGKAALRNGTYVKKKTFNEHRNYIMGDLGGSNIVEFLKRSIIKLSVESGKSYNAIFKQFDNNNNGTLEPNEIWEWFTRLAPGGLLTTVDFRALILPQLYGLLPSDMFTPEAIARLHLHYEKFEKWVLEADVSFFLSLFVLLMLKCSMFNVMLSLLSSLSLSLSLHLDQILTI